MLDSVRAVTEYIRELRRDFFCLKFQRVGLKQVGEEYQISSLILGFSNKKYANLSFADF